MTCWIVPGRRYPGAAFNDLQENPETNRQILVFADHRDFTETCRQVRAFQQRYPKTGTILIEEAANGSAIINVLTREVPGIIAVTPDGGKYARAQAAQPMLEAGNIWLPNPRPYGRLLAEREWVEDFLHQLCVFPTGAHDDDVDAFTQLVARCVEPEFEEWCTW